MDEPRLEIQDILPVLDPKKNGPSETVGPFGCSLR